MNRDAAHVFPQEKRQEGDHDEQHRVVHRAVVALVYVYRLIERHTDAALRERGFGSHSLAHFEVIPALTEGAIDLQHGPMGGESLVGDHRIERRRGAFETRMWPLGADVDV